MIDEFLDEEDVTSWDAVETAWDDEVDDGIMGTDEVDDDIMGTEDVLSFLVGRVCSGRPTSRDLPRCR